MKFSNKGRFILCNVKGCGLKISAAFCVENIYYSKNALYKAFVDASTPDASMPNMIDTSEDP